LCGSEQDVDRVRDIADREADALAWLGRTLQPADKLLDIGAGIGVRTGFAALRMGPSGRVYAFEPSLTDATTLLRNIEANRVSDQVIVATAHLLDRNEMVDSGVPPERALASDVTEPRDPAPVRRTVELTHAYRFDTLIDRGLVPAPTVVAINAPGGAARAIAGMEMLLRSRQAPRLVAVATGAADADDLALRMRDAGYQPVSDAGDSHSAVRAGQTVFAKSADRPSVGTE
jgi:FkbM family methyltransferase